MMSRTHLAVGVAAALALAGPASPQEWMVAVIGGAAGSVVSDIDIVDNDRGNDAHIGQAVPVGITLCCLAADAVFGLGLWQQVAAQEQAVVLAGAMGYLFLCWLGYRSSHRTFTHSLLAMALFTLTAWLVFPPLAPGFAAGFASHLVLDLLNKKGMRILYPLPISPCLGLCYAGGTANKVLFRLGMAACLLLTVLSLWRWLAG